MVRSLNGQTQRGAVFENGEPFLICHCSIEFLIDHSTTSFPRPGIVCARLWEIKEGERVDKVKEKVGANSWFCREGVLIRLVKDLVVVSTKKKGKVKERV